MIDYSAVYDSLLSQQEQDYDNAFDRADIVQVQQLNIAFWAITNNRIKRLQLLGDIVGRSIGSTKDLKVGEVQALLKLLDQPSFVEAMKQEAN